MINPDKEEGLLEARNLTAVKNMSIMENLVEHWHLGPKVAYDNQQKNDEFWESLAKVMFVTVDEARRYSCASCKYGNIRPEFLKEMEHIPYNDLDKDGGIRVWCDKFDFICHTTRVCQAYI
jgi:Tfp pilus assembly protein PilV